MSDMLAAWDVFEQYLKERLLLRNIAEEEVDGSGAKELQDSSLRSACRQGYGGVEGPQSRYGGGGALWLFSLAVRTFT
jgi:hypothetical protein